MKRMNIQKIALIGVMSAVVFATNYLSVPIPGNDGARIHLANVFCIIAGLLLGPVSGGFAAGIGSAFYDLTNPLYVTSIPFTFVFKFILAFVCGKIAYAKGKDGLNMPFNFLGASLGSITYLLLHVTRYYIRDVAFLAIQPNPALVATVQRLITSGTNAVVAVVIGVPLALSVRKALDKTSLTEKIHHI